jgi:hypothetical protein
LEAEPKANIAITPPTSDDDMNAGYLEGTTWINTMTQQAYILVDSTAGAAVWKLITNAPTVYAIGDTGPAGGIVFYVTDGGAHGLEAAPSDSPSAQWGCSTIPVDGADGTGFGAGQHNTDDILAAGCTESPIAAEVANTLINGSLGWFLPSKNELNELYIHRVVVGGFVNEFYWSSSEATDSSAWALSCLDGAFVDENIKSTINLVRAIRAF